MKNRIIHQLFFKVLLAGFWIFVLSACKPIENEGEADWATVDLSIDQPEANGKSRSVSTDNMGTAVILAVSTSTTTISSSTYLSDYYARGLLDLSSGKVQLSLPLNVPLRFAELVFSESLTLSQILSSQPTIYMVGFSDPITISGEEDALNVSISLSSDSDITTPLVMSFSPENSSTEIPVNNDISVKFSKIVDSTTVSVNTTDTDCSGSFQLSADNFITCIQMSASPTINNSGLKYTVIPDAELEYYTHYNIKITTDVMDMAGNTLTETVTTSDGFTTGVQTAGYFDEAVFDEDIMGN